MPAYEAWKILEGMLGAPAWMGSQGSTVEGPGVGKCAGGGRCQNLGGTAGPGRHEGGPSREGDTAPRKLCVGVRGVGSPTSAEVGSNLQETEEGPSPEEAFWAGGGGVPA